MNTRIIMERLSEIGENLDIIGEYKDTPLDKFTSDPHIYKLVERCLQICIECILDIANYLIAQNNWPRPKNDAEAIIVLGAHQVIPDDFAKSIVGMANFRNILVHGYLKIDRNIVHTYMQRIDDFRKFEEYILKNIQRH